MACARIAIVLFLMIGSNLFGNSWPKPEILTFKKKVYHPKGAQTLSLVVHHYANPGGRPLILAHPLMLSAGAMTYYAKKFWKAGYDVYAPNVRSHGIGVEKSKIKPYYKSSYSFDHILGDMEFLFNSIHSLNPQKVTIVGYSMGGMLWEQYLSGVSLIRGHMNQKDSKAHSRAKNVKAFIGITVPPDLSQINSYIRRLTKPIKYLVNMGHFTIPIEGLFSHQKHKSKNYIALATASSLLSIVWNISPKGVFNVANMSKGEFRTIAHHYLSSPHSDFLSDYLRWFQHPYQSRDKKVNYGSNKKVFVKTLHFAGEDDTLAPAEYIARQSKLYPQEAHIEVKRIKGLAHIDVLAKKVRKKLSSQMLSWLGKDKLQN